LWAVTVILTFLDVIIGPFVQTAMMRAASAQAFFRHQDNGSPVPMYLMWLGIHIIAAVLTLLGARLFLEGMIALFSIEKHLRKVRDTAEESEHKQIRDTAAKRTKPERRSPTLGVCMICTATFGNGVVLRPAVTA
jgi:multisubunit Na+/H+ antiporter MnhG subunit